MCITDKLNWGKHLESMTMIISKKAIYLILILFIEKCQKNHL